MPYPPKPPISTVNPPACDALNIAFGIGRLSSRIALKNTIVNTQTTLNISKQVVVRQRPRISTRSSRKRMKKKISFKMDPVPQELRYGLFFNRVRERYELCGIRPENCGSEFLVMKCRGCARELHYDWLSKKPDQKWTDSEFSRRLKQNLLTIRGHRKCKEKFEEEKNRLQNGRDEHVRSTDKSELKDLKEQLAKSEEKYLKLIKTLKKQKIKVKKPAMSQPRRLKIAASQNWKCNMCAKMLSSCFEIDHIKRWSESFDDSDENLQALCVECHLIKTADENSDF